MSLWGSRFHREHALDAGAEAASGLTDIESFLYREAHEGAARRRAAEFTARTPGLSPEQKRRIEQWYVHERKHIARMVTDHIPDRIESLEEQHRVRLRSRRWAMITVMACLTAVLIVCVAVSLGASR
ncbi:hypothetical protein ABZY14_09100 [Streptomyces sp. NPDC006617]|uniref:hypothetical protein n=1 Tax=Streptomyces sp. NPDC006617 TaxID=3155354 RepID=UPI0033A3133A